jgi:4-amino-4-deoxy-L-arabinose transferase-like glycosyltransferase
MIRYIKQPLFFFCLFAFFLFSWPFISFPLTDGDIVNWSQISVLFMNGENLFSGGNDQGHGPLMAWTGALFLSLIGHSFYALNLFNILIGVLGVYLVYSFCDYFWRGSGISNIAAFLYVTSLAPIYLSRTPMYDWPAAIFYFGFSFFYLIYAKEEKLRYLIYALLFIGVGSLSRFSISLGLAGFYIIGIRLFVFKNYKRLIFDGLCIIFSVFLFNIHWFLGQYSTQGDSFLNTFIYDNTGRYIKSTRPDAYIRKDYYGFLLYTLLGLLPFTFCYILSFFKKDFFKKLNADSYALALFIGFFPCLLFFSFSGHTKLARYIAYVFPFIIALGAYFLVKFDLNNHDYRKKCGITLKWVSAFLFLLLIQQSIYFYTEAVTSISFVLSIFILFFGLIYYSYYVLVKKYQKFLECPHSFLFVFGLLYGSFFTFLTFQMHRAPFLIEVRNGIDLVLDRII